ncbi:uncharacterized protein LOC121739962 [Aricia agestis]|uniref:uncharacterized protein LOC121739962 n=1 Tax=Aricia agestis TaxID=91739 RepID=UPI001C20AF02|nr:uncharacterized protein LOC121739962 [Aricia agestis]
MVSNTRVDNPVKKEGIKKQKKKEKPNPSVNNSLKKDVEIEVPIAAVNFKKDVTNEDETIPEELSEKYPVLKDEALIKKFQSVKVNNNQKGRIRQVLKDQLKDTSDNVLPDVIHSRIQGIIKDSKDLTEPELRKIRILYNMLKTAVQTTKPDDGKIKKKSKNKRNKNKKSEPKDESESGVQTETQTVEKLKSTDSSKDTDSKAAQENKNKPKGPKRYVVFVGNLPPQIEKETIMTHFKDLADQIVSVRIPKQEEGKKSSIAYVELKSEHSYELALSKHHSMLGTKRINVLYTTQKNSKISKTEAKSKSAKLIALQKSGKLAGSVAMNKKRSHRRNKAKRAQAKLQTSAK